MSLLVFVAREGWAFVRYDMPDLTSRNISKIIQDSKGFIWIATDNGLNRFDGWSNQAYSYNRNDTTSLMNNQVEDLFNDSEGNLWVASGAGLQLYVSDTGRFRTVRFPNGIKAGVRSIIEKGPHELMVVTSGYGAFSIDTRTMSATPMHQLNDLIGTVYAHKLMLDALNRIWIAAAGGRLVVVDRNLNLIYDTMFPQKVIDMAGYAGNEVLVATSCAIYRWDGARRRFDMLETAPAWNITGFMTASSGDVYVHTLESGVFRLTTGAGGLIPEMCFASMKDEGIAVMAEDRGGDIWFGTRKGGVLMYSCAPDLFRYHDIPTPASVKIECMFELADRSGIAVALSDGRILSFDTDLCPKATHHTQARVTSAVRSSGGHLLMGYADGRIMEYDGQDAKLIGNSGDKEISALAEDASGRIYAAVTGGGFMYRDKSGDWQTVAEATPMATSAHLGNDWLNSIVADKQGKIWFAHHNGIDIFDPETATFVECNTINQLRAHIVYAILLTKDGSAWIGTNNGLYHIQPGKETMDFFGVAEGLSGNIVCGIEQANNGDIWCTTSNGLTRIRYADGKIITYLNGNGLEEHSYRKKLLLRNSNGKLYAGGYGGLTAFFPDAVSDDSPLYAPTLTRVYLDRDNESYPIIAYSDGDSDIAATVRLKHYQNTFSIEFSTFDYRNAGNVSFEYRIPSLEKEWRRTPLGDNRIVCNYMDPGNYILEVRALENGLASPIARIRIVILPPWYLTWWAKCLYALIFAGAVAGVWYVWSRYLRHRRNEEIAEEKFRFFYNFAHELRSPITLMTSPLTALIDNETDPRKADTYRMIQRNGYRVINLVNEMLDIRRIEKGQLKLEFTETGLEGYLRRIVDDFSYQAGSRGINLIFSAPDGDIEAYIDPGNFDKVIVNLLTNALKYTPDGGSVDVVLKKGTVAPDGVAGAVVEVRDTGTGIPAEQLGHIFERFYQGSRKNMGFGIGLNLSQMLMELHHGSISAANREDTAGSVFAVAVPLGRKHLSDDEIRVDTPMEAPRKYIVPEAIEAAADPLPAKGGTPAYKILVADDDDEIRHYLKAELEPTYRIVTASDGNEAYRLAQETDIDLIISDVMMPDADGFTLLKKTRNNADLAHIPVILLTSSDSFETRMSGWSKGADAYLTKPFRIEELRQLCASLISGRVRLRGRYSNGRKVEQAIEKVEVKGNDEVFLEKVMKATNENIGNSEFGVEELAETVGISRAHLHRRLKELLGLAPREFLKSIRLKQAAELLKKNNVNISQVGYMVGFSSPGQFSDAFKKYFGCTPTEFIGRESHEASSAKSA